ncbi:MAG: hypothetical protein QXD23_02420, partial [Candidatus Micrarchaeaceae archaeon]
SKIGSVKEQISKNLYFMGSLNSSFDLSSANFSAIYYSSYFINLIYSNLSNFYNISIKSVVSKTSIPQVLYKKIYNDSGAFFSYWTIRNQSYDGLEYSFENTTEIIPSGKIIYYKLNYYLLAEKDNYTSIFYATSIYPYTKTIPNFNITRLLSYISNYS